MNGSMLTRRSGRVEKNAAFPNPLREAHIWQLKHLKSEADGSADPTFEPECQTPAFFQENQPSPDRRISYSSLDFDEHSPVAVTFGYVPPQQKRPPVEDTGGTLPSFRSIRR